MARYIDADKLIQRLEREVESCKDPSKGSALGFKMAISIAQTFRREEDIAPRAEVAREVIEEIEAIINSRYDQHVFSRDLEDTEAEAVMDFQTDLYFDIRKLKKKYNVTDTKDGHK